MNIRGWMIGLLLVGLFMAAKAEAASVLPLSVEQMTRGAEKIFVGTCIATEESVNEYGLSVLTVTFTVQEALKGDMGQTVTFRQLNPIQPPPPQPGVGGLWQDIQTFGLPSYTHGEEAVLFLAKEGKIGLTAPLGLAQGKMPVAVTATGGKQVINQAWRIELPQNPAIPLPGKVGDYTQFVTTLRNMVQTGK